jgi:hypothetical protein
VNAGTRSDNQIRSLACQHVPPHNPGTALHHKLTRVPGDSRNLPNSSFCRFRFRMPCLYDPRPRNQTTQQISESPLKVAAPHFMLSRSRVVWPRRLRTCIPDGAHKYALRGIRGAILCVGRQGDLMARIDGTRRYASTDPTPGLLAGSSTPPESKNPLSP